MALLDNTDPDPAEGFGVSIYYSQVLQVLFFSYSNGMRYGILEIFREIRITLFQNIPNIYYLL